MEAEARELVAELKRLKELASARKPFDPDEIVQALGIKLAEVRRSVADAQIQTTHRQELFEAKMIERLATLRDGRDGADGVQGAPGERGEPGPPGMLPIVRAWHDAVHYAGQVVTLGGSVYQAQRDTGRAPPHDDWLCIAAAGRDGADGRSFTIRGTWSEAEAYRHLDVVALNGASFAARQDDPGPCPGEGWQLIAGQGKPGRSGEPGRSIRGEQGPPSPAGPAAVAMDLDEEAVLRQTHADGSVLSVDFYPLLSKLGH
jgi:hypothetical protein